MGSGTGAPSDGQFDERGISWTNAGPERSLALAGVVAVVLIAGQRSCCPGSPPKPDDSATKIAKFLVDKSDQIRWAGFLGVLGSIVLLGWLGAVWRLMRRAEGGDPLARGAALGAVLAPRFSTRGRAAERHGHRRPADAWARPGPAFFYLLYQQPGRARRDGVWPVHRLRVSTVIIETGVLPKRAGVARRADRAGAASRRAARSRSTRDVFFVLSLRRLHRRSRSGPSS